MQWHGNTNKSPTKINVAENKFDTVICLRMRKTFETKPHQVNLRSPLSRIHYYKITSSYKYKESYQTLWPIPKYQRTVEPLPQYPIGLIL